MNERMWPRIAWAAVALLAMSGVALAEMLSRGSGPLHIQIGIDDRGAPVYADCGELRLYKTDTQGGRSWVIEDSCAELMSLMKPTPTVTRTPIWTTPPTPPPTPGGCPDGVMSRLNEKQWRLVDVTLEQQRPYTYCFDLPASTRFFFEVKTVNKGNSSCSDLEMTVVSPSGVEYFSNGSQPGAPPLYQAGRWKLKLFLNEGCTRYDVNVTTY